MKNVKNFFVATCLLITATASTMNIGTSMAGEVQFSRSGVRDMLIRVSGDERYLLIPIEEAAPEYRMQVIENGQISHNILRLSAKASRSSCHGLVRVRATNSFSLYMCGTNRTVSVSANYRPWTISRGAR